MTERVGNPSWGHPVLEAFIQQHDCDTAKTHLAFLAYMNLAEVRGWRDVNLHYCERLQTPFITGRVTLSADLEAVLPMAMDESLSHQQMQTLFGSICVDDQKFNRIVLAICASDTSIVYYKVSHGIIKPEPPEVSEARKQEWQQRAAKRRLCVAECIETFSRQHDHDENPV